MKSEEFAKKVCMSEIDCSNRRGRLVVRWKVRVKEYMHGRVVDKGGIEQARKERWRLFLHGLPLRERGVRNYK